MMWKCVFRNQTERPSRHVQNDAIYATAGSHARELRAIVHLDSQADYKEHRAEPSKASFTKLQTWVTRICLLPRPTISYK